MGLSSFQSDQNELWRAISEERDCRVASLLAMTAMEERVSRNDGYVDCSLGSTVSVSEQETQEARKAHFSQVSLSGGCRTSEPELQNCVAIF